MRILLAHNYYQQPGGEDAVYADEARMLEQHGHDVVRYAVHNDSVSSLGPIALATRTVWSRPSQAELRTLMRRERPDVVHFHNTLPLISPAGYYAGAAERIPVVQTLHNYRLTCPKAVLYRDGAPCQDCVGKAFAYPGIIHKCYRDSRAATAAVAMTAAVHRMLGTWERRVARYIAPTDFARQIYVKAGFAADKVVVKPNFVAPDPGIGSGEGRYALFVGRLSPEKGIRTLLAAWSELGASIPLRIVGDGPLADVVERAARLAPGIEWLGRRAPAEVLALLRESAFLVFPSEWYETFGRVAVEAFATGTPVLGADIGAIAELVQDGRTGRLFRPGDSDDLAAKARQMLCDPRLRAAWRTASRLEYEAKYTSDRNYAALMAIYENVIREQGAAPLV